VWRRVEMKEKESGWEPREEAAETAPMKTRQATTHRQQDTRAQMRGWGRGESTDQEKKTGKEGKIFQKKKARHHPRWQRKSSNSPPLLPALKMPRPRLCML